MLVVDGLSKIFRTPSGPRCLFEGLSFQLPRDGRLAVLGRNGQGKSTLIKVLGGVTPPSAGRIDWRMRPSWPLGFAGGFQGSLTGLDNIRFISRIYNEPVDLVAARTEEFAQLGEDLAKPVKHYSSGMRARLAFGLSLAIEFDCYLIDEVVAVGDSSFREASQRELFDRRRDRAFIIASHDVELIRSTCRRALVVEGGRVKWFDDIEAAIEIYSALGLRADPSAEPIAPLESAETDW
jgi:capsular polysaccharide transport system ATP-binding protein